MGNINWAGLYESGRCKAIGIPWTEAEKHAIYVLHVPVDFVRRGCLTVEVWKQMEGKQLSDEVRTGKVQVRNLKREQLVALCLKNNIPVTDDAIRPVLLEALENAGVPKGIPAEDVPKTA